ncbi:hypothetical protein ANO11243_015710 [Dothideomycetidae sp. 11243]|nr:hypothetical protein ANO11243_015710 [fungal sp. No.11243]
MTDGEQLHQQIFFAVVFTVIQGDKITERDASEIRQQLVDNGARFVPLREDGSVDDIAQLSHIISSHIDFPEYHASLDFNCHVVKPSWVNQSLIKKRLVQARQHSPDPALIFQDVVVAYGDLPQGDRDAITAGVMAMGGMYSAAMTKLVTHIVSLTEDSDKIRIVKNMKLSTKVVLPHWFDDCLKLGKKISETPYVLPNPEIFEPGSFPTRKMEAQPDLAGALSAPGAPTTPRKHLNVFSGKRIYFSADLNIHDKLATTLADLSEYSGGKLSLIVDQCDVYVGHYRDGPGYVQASRAQKIVGNLAWFYDVITRNRWTNPQKKLLHYPVPRHGMDGFRGLKISLSNYTGDARSYLENIIVTAGGEFTRTMKQDNTHLVTAHKKSEKCDAAQEWNIHIINHLWLEESYAKCQVESLTNPRYVHFPPRTNLSEIVGQTAINMDRVEELYFPEDSTSMQGSAGPAKAAKQSARKSLPSAAAMRTNVVLEEQRTPVARRGLPEKENEAPSSTARASKMKAAEKLEKAAVDIAAFEKEMKRKGGVTHGRKRGQEEVDEDETSTPDISGDEEIAASRPGKKQRTKDAATADQVPVKYRMLTTGEDRWSKKAKKEADDRKTLRSLGIQVITNPIECNLLCAPRILRTRKFVMAISCAPEIVNTGYLDYALKHRELQDTAAYGLQDREMESKWGINLAESLLRAKDNNHKLLRGWTLYVTDKVGGGFETFKDIIEANGGTAIPYKGRTGVQLPRRRLKLEDDPEAGLESQNQGGNEETDYVYLISGTADEEVKIWPTFRKLAEKQGLEARIVKTDWVLNCAMAQRVEWDEQWELSEESPT